jgi:integrase
VSWARFSDGSQPGALEAGNPSWRTLSILSQPSAGGMMVCRKRTLLGRVELGAPVHPQAFSEAFGRHAKAAGLPKIPLHGLRHTHATLALQAGIHPKVVSDRLGHYSAAFTLDTYSEAIPALQESAAETVAALIRGS